MFCMWGGCENVFCDAKVREEMDGLEWYIYINDLPECLGRFGLSISKETFLESIGFAPILSSPILS